MAKEKVSGEKLTLQETITKMNKEYGKNSIMSSVEYIDPKNIISSGSILLNRALGVGGYVRGRVVEIMGWSSGGKSTTTLHAIAESQKKGLRCALIDGEGSFDRKYAESIGVIVNEEDPNHLIVSQPGYGEAAYDIANALISTGEVHVVIIDSQTSLLPKKAMEGNGGEYALGLHARMMSLEIPKLMNNALKNNALVIIISQYREKIGVMFGNPTTTNGGHALPFYSHVRLEVSRNTIDKAEEINNIKVKVVKNKLAIPFKEAEIEILWGVGFNKTKEIIDLAIEYNIIEKSGNTYSYKETKLGVGEKQLNAFIEANDGLLEEIKPLVLEQLNK